MKEIYYFGSFNPFHYGHKMIALIASSLFDCKVHITPSPCSPFKKKEDMLPVEIRKEIIEASIDKYESLDISDIDIEVTGDKDVHYSYETLEVIKERANAAPKEIGFLFGSDVLAKFDKWKNWKWIYSNFTLIVYPREGDNIRKLLKKYPEVKLASFSADTVLFDHSSTEIRELLKDFDENYEELSSIYNEKCMKILEKYYKK